MSAINDKTHISQGFTEGFTSGQLPTIHHGLPCLGCDDGGLSQAPSKTQVNHQPQRSVAGDLGQPATRTDQQGC